MRPRQVLRNARQLHAAVAAVILPVVGSAAALAAGQADAQSAIQASLDRSHVAYGNELKVNGTAGQAAAGHQVQLQFVAAGRSSWQNLAVARVRRDGSFTLKAQMRRSGVVRVSDAGSEPARRSRNRPSSTPATSNAGAIAPPSGAQPIAVAARFVIQARTVALLRGAAHVRGRLLPELAGRKVLLSNEGSQKAIAVGFTGPHGGFDLRVEPARAGSGRVRVRFSGDRINTRSSAPAGRISRFRQSVASWYNDAGATACGFHAHFGVANRDLPCGTKVTFLYGGRIVHAVVDDRGPYVGGRDWDLNQNTAGALGFGGVDSVWSSL